MAEARARESEVFAALIAAARQRQREAQAQSPLAPRFLLENARAMATHLGLPEQRMQDCLAAMGLWQLYLQSAVGARRWDFAAVRDAMPWSYERLRAALLPLQSRAQVVHTAFHMAAFPLVCALIGTVWRDLYGGPLHLLVASRNMGWFRLEGSRWVGEMVELVSTEPAGLRRLMAGLRQGTIRRLLILVDGPQAPGAPGTRALAGISPALGIRTALLAKLHALGIPLVPVTHEWEEAGLVVTPQPPLEPSVLAEAGYVSAVATHIEGLLRRHPEQWLNWNAARIRT